MLDEIRNFKQEKSLVKLIQHDCVEVTNSGAGYIEK